MTKRKARPPEPAAPTTKPRFSINWPPGFKSQIVVSRTGKFETDFERQQRHRDHAGWNTHVIGLPGNVRYVSAGAIGMMARPKS